MDKKNIRFFSCIENYTEGTEMTSSNKGKKKIQARRRKIQASKETSTKKFFQEVWIPY